MNLKLRISEDLKSAMKSKDTNKMSILRVLKGEIERLGQDANGRVEVTDGEIVKLVKKILEGIKQTKYIQDEIDALELYLPKQMSEAEMKLITRKVRESGASNVGDFMKYFKANHDGEYDGKALSIIVKEVLV